MLHKIIISRVTISFTKFIKDITRGGSVHDSRYQAFSLGIQPNGVLWDFLYKQFHSLLHPSVTQIFISCHYTTVSISLNNCQLLLVVHQSGFPALET